MIIARYGHPVAKLVPLKPFRQNRRPGTARGKITIQSSFFEPLSEALITLELNRNQFETLVVDNQHAYQAGQLPLHHKDPFDRMLVAQAQIESLSLITNDSKFKSYDIELCW